MKNPRKTMKKFRFICSLFFLFLTFFDFLIFSLFVIFSHFTLFGIQGSAGARVDDHSERGSLWQIGPFAKPGALLVFDLFWLFGEKSNYRSSSRTVSQALLLMLPPQHNDAPFFSLRVDSKWSCHVNTHSKWRKHFEHQSTRHSKLFYSRCFFLFFPQ